MSTTSWHPIMRDWHRRLAVALSRNPEFWSVDQYETSTDHGTLSLYTSWRRGRRRWVARLSDHNPHPEGFGGSAGCWVDRDRCKVSIVFSRHQSAMHGPDYVHEIIEAVTGDPLAGAAPQKRKGIKAC